MVSLPGREDYYPAQVATEKLELTELVKKINVPALLARASHLRQGIPCSVPPFEYDRASQNDVMGGTNYHIEITFEDGVQWMAASVDATRSRLRHPSEI